MAFLTGIIGFILGVLLSILIAIFGIFGFILPGDASFDSEEADGAFTAYVVPVLVDPMWVSLEQQANPDLIIVAVASAAEFEAAHIEGAVRIEPSEIDIAASGDPDWQFEFETLLGDSGISPQSTVVVYDYGDASAARLWWSLSRISHPAVAVLDGGIDAWESRGFDVATGEPPAPIVRTVYFGYENEALVASTADVEAALDDPEVVIIDARPATTYARGHIPGAINIPADSNFGPDGALLPVEELESLYETARVFPDKQVIIYCQTGVLSTNTALALTSLGYGSVQIYTGSWSEWSSDPARPVEN